MKAPSPHADDYIKDSPGGEVRPGSLEESQATAGKGNFQGKKSDRCTAPHGASQGHPTPANLHNKTMPPMAHVAVEAPQQPYTQQGGHSIVPQKEPLRTDEQRADYVNQSRVQAMIKESKARRHQCQVSPESPHSAPMPGEPQFNLPPPVISYSEEVPNKSHDPAAAVHQGGPLHVQGNVQQGGTQGSVQGRVKGTYGGGGYGGGGHRSWDGASRQVGGRDGHGGGGDGHGGGGDGHGGGGHDKGAQFRGGQQSGMHELYPGDRQGDQYGPTSLQPQPSPKVAAHKHQNSPESFGRLRSGSNPERHSYRKKQQSPVHLPYDPLSTSIDAQMHDVAEYFMDEEGQEHPVTGLQAPEDPNLTCVVCGRVFRLGEIQLFRSHVATCGTSEV